MAARLAGRPELDLTVIDNDPRIAQAVRTGGLTLKQGNRSWTRPVRLVQNAEGEPAFDAVILATRSNSLAGAAENLRAHLRQEASVITVQNGLVALDLADVVGADHLVPGCVLWGASMESPGVYRITNTGTFIIGRLNGASSARAVDTAQTVLSRIFPVRVSQNIRGVLWSKLAITATFTALGAITGLRFGKLAANREIRNIILKIGRELFLVARAEGITFEPLGTGLDIERFLSEDGYSAFLKHLLIRVIGHRNRHDESSMLASIRGGRKTEIEFINGRLVQAADRRGVPVPYNRLAVNLVEEMERGRRRPAPENLAAFRGLK
jgi:2-dehydropantoate 2-reductase